MFGIPPWMIAPVVALLALVVILIVRALFSTRDPELQRRLSGRGSSDSGEFNLGPKQPGDSESELLLRGARKAEEATGMRWLDHAFDRMIVRTGLEVTPSQALGFTALLGAALFAIFYLWREQVWLSMIGLILGMGIPLLAFWYLQSRYQKRLMEQLPDAFYVLARSLRAGMNLEQALDLVGTQGVQPLAGEFRRCAAQIRLGLTIPAALQLMAQRLQMLDFNSFVSIVTYYQGTGGNLPLLLDRLAVATRDRNQFRGQFFAVTAQARITAIFLGLFPFAILLGYALFEPEHVQTFFRSTWGWMLLAGAFCLQLIGAFWVYRLLRIAY